MTQRRDIPSADSTEPSSPRGLLIVISGPSGVGKTSIVHRLVERLGAVFSISMTTRAQTTSDREGIDYYFVDEQRFREAVDRGELLEWAMVFDHHYGTPRQPVEEHLTAGRDVVLEIDVDGAIQIRQAMPESLLIFVSAPSEDELLNRLRKRAREDEATIQRRFREAQREMKQARDSRAYDHFLINDDLDRAVDEACDIVQQRKTSV